MKTLTIIVCVICIGAASGVYASYSSTESDRGLIEELIPVIHQTDCKKKQKIKRKILNFFIPYYDLHPEFGPIIDETKSNDVSGTYRENFVDNNIEYVLYSLVNEIGKSANEQCPPSLPLTGGYPRPSNELLYPNM